MDIVHLIVSCLAILFVSYAICLIATVRQRFTKNGWNLWLITVNILLLIAMIFFIPLWIYASVGGYRDPGVKQDDPFTEVWFYWPLGFIAVLVSTLVYARIRMVRTRGAPTA